MGTWSTSISGDDIYQDVYHEFIDLYDQGYDPKDISDKLIKENDFLVKKPHDANSFWFALAKAQWECGELDAKLLEKIVIIASSKDESKRWQQLGASTADSNQREKAVQKLLALLQTPRQRPRRRRKPNNRIHLPQFDKGDCLSFQYPDNSFGAAIVLSAVSGTAKDGSYNLIAFTNIHHETQPTLQDITNSDVLLSKLQTYSTDGIEEWKTVYHACWHSGIRGKDKCDSVTVVGAMPVAKIYDHNDYESDFNMYSGPFSGQTILGAFNWIKSEVNAEATKATKLRKLTNKQRWFKNFIPRRDV